MVKNISNILVKKNILAYLLLPVSWIYGIIVYFRNKCFELGFLKEVEFKIPIISVGNITVGGTGKTPHIEYLISLLKDDFKIAVLSRGYKRKTKGFILADSFSDAETIGDEPCQMKRKFPGIVLAVDSDRKNGINRIINSGIEIDLILLDDAFQHRYVKPGLSILLIDFNRPILKDFLMPAGQLREPASGRNRADIILVSKSPENLTPVEQSVISRELYLTPLQYLFFSTVLQEELLPVFNDSPGWQISTNSDSNPSVLLISGIANPLALKQFAQKISTSIREIHFRDHHAFTKKDISEIIRQFEIMEGREKILITSEKDAVRLLKYADLLQNIKDRMFYIPIRIGFLNNDTENFNDHIIAYVRNNKTNSILLK
jgi:tetraacyldisaccharide 4'-kinase